MGETMGAGGEVCRRVSLLAVDLVVLDIFGVYESVNESVNVHG